MWRSSDLPAPHTAPFYPAVCVAAFNLPIER
jgi:hypothetical protein